MVSGKGKVLPRVSPAVCGYASWLAHRAYYGGGSGHCGKGDHKESLWPLQGDRYCGQGGGPCHAGHFPPERGACGWKLQRAERRERILLPPGLQYGGWQQDTAAFGCGGTAGFKRGGHVFGAGGPEKGENGGPGGAADL